ncbi:neuraminidase-like domain-containing protein, partial [Thiocapsa sp.]|uniref:neuraminidase-like domain-containing protein n=1 Tax=Thiocapsa sp. TaxID=2024551 RepID=UPI0035936818
MDRFLDGLHALVIAERAANRLLGESASGEAPVESPDKVAELLRANLAAWLGVDEASLDAGWPIGAIQDFAARPAGAPRPASNDALDLLIRWIRVARLLKQLALSAKAWDAVRAVRAENGFLDPAVLFGPPPPPRDPPDPARDSADRRGRCTAWLALARAAAWSRLLPSDESDLFDWLGKAADPRLADADLLAGIELATGWSLDPATGQRYPGLVKDVALLFAETMAGTLDSAVTRSVLRLAGTYAAIDTAVRRMRQWRIRPETLLRWSQPIEPPPESDSTTPGSEPPWTALDLVASLENASNARLPDPADWYRVLTPINDRLRERRRETLLTALLAYGAPDPEGTAEPLRFSDASEVYAHYLIDPEMTGCMQTTRIVQANAAIQLFVQRILQNLEDQLRPDTDTSEAWRAIAEDWHEHWARWPVMKHYRVWEANRKVFFYPENWLFPELRDDKSPLFTDLENALLQDEVNDRTVERAYREYLARLHEVARLDMRGFYIEEDHNPRGELRKQVMHLFARTHSEPHFYFYRRRDLLTEIWSAWEKVDLNIEGEHLIPVVHNGQLMLFWALFREKGGSGEERGFSQYELSLAFSRYREGRWEASRQSQVIRVLDGIEKQDTSFRVQVQDGQIKLWVFINYVKESVDFGEDRLGAFGDSYVVLNTCENILIPDLQPERVPILAFPDSGRMDLAGQGFTASDSLEHPLAIRRRPLWEIDGGALRDDLANYKNAAERENEFTQMLDSLKEREKQKRDEGDIGAASDLLVAIHTAELNRRTQTNAKVQAIIRIKKRLFDLHANGGRDRLANRMAPSVANPHALHGQLPSTLLRELDGGEAFFFQNDRHSILVSPAWPTVQRDSSLSELGQIPGQDNQLTWSWSIGFGGLTSYGLFLGNFFGPSSFRFELARIAHQGFRWPESGRFARLSERGWPRQDDGRAERRQNSPQADRIE